MACLGPLSFEEKTETKEQEEATQCRPSPDKCLLCEAEYGLKTKEGFEEFLKHLLVEHKLVVADVRLIADVSKYVAYWRKRFKEKPLAEFCSVIKTNSGVVDTEESELYYLLADITAEDKALREKLQRDKLETVLKQQQKERQDDAFSRCCLFCLTNFHGNRADLFNHMNIEHSFSVGHPDNLVYTDEYLDLLQDKLKSLECLYCEKIFKDRQALKEHMRKKNHKRINPHNHIYDRFYVINYLEMGKNWEDIQSEDENEDRKSTTSSANDDWSDWRADGAEFQAVCLYCDHRSEEAHKALLHMKEAHGFDLPELRKELDLSFYQQVKLINFIRRQVHRNTCPSCGHVTVTEHELREHLETSGHVGKAPSPSEWDQPQYYFPTYENDNLLCALDDNDDVIPENCDCDVTSTGNQFSASAHTGEVHELKKNDTANSLHTKTANLVIAEDFPVRESVLKNESVLAELRKS